MSLSESGEHLSLEISPHLKCVAVKCQYLKSNNWKQDDFCKDIF